MGGEEIAPGDLATALGVPAATRVRVQPLSEVPTPARQSYTGRLIIDGELYTVSEAKKKFTVK